MRSRMAQQRMTLGDLEWPFHALRAISSVAELLVLLPVTVVQKCLFSKPGVLYKVTCTNK